MQNNYLTNHAPGDRCCPIMLQETGVDQSCPRRQIMANHAPGDRCWSMMPEEIDVDQWCPRRQMSSNHAAGDRCWLIKPKETDVGQSCPRTQILANHASGDRYWLAVYYIRLAPMIEIHHWALLILVVLCEGEWVSYCVISIHGYISWSEG